MDADETSMLLLTLARRVTARHGIEDVLTETFACLRDHVRLGGGSIQLLDDDGWIRMAAAEPIAPDHVMQAQIPLGASVAGRVILTERPVYIADLEAGVPERGGGPVSGGVRSYLGIPLVCDGRAIGVVQFDDPEPNAWTGDQRALLVAAGAVMAAAIQNARAHARVAAARVETDRVTDRLAEARRVLASLRRTAGADEALRHEVDRLDQVLAEPETPAPATDPPHPRTVASH